MTQTLPAASTAVIGAGIVGIAVAYYLCVRHGQRDVVLVEAGAPMAMTSARSGENYRNWWPQQVMQEFTSHSIAEMEIIARATGNRIRMNRRGYVLATRRADPSDLIAELHAGYGAEAGRMIRMHEGATAAAYQPADSPDWESAPDGVDVLLDRALIRATFPGFDPATAAILHIRRGGDISGQQLGQAMLGAIRAAGGRLVRGRVRGIASASPLRIEIESGAATSELRAEAIVNAAGPYASAIAEMHGETLPFSNVLQQKITFEDRAGAVPRALPFSIDLDGQTLDWAVEERDLLASEPASVHLTRPMPGSIHCRPDGGDAGRWIKLGWAFNTTASDPVDDPVLDPQFPDIVLRGASRLQPALRTYLGRLPRNAVHYGGYYTMTEENWPLIGPMATQGAFVAGGLSGFGTMSACATGALSAAWITGATLPGYAAKLSRARYADAALMAALTGPGSRGVL